MSAVDITKVLLPELVVLDDETITSKEELFTVISKKFEEAGIVDHAADLEAALYKRETEGSTYMGGLGFPLAIPHGITEAVKSSSVGFVRVKNPFTYKSKDEEGDVKYAFVLGIVGGDGGSLTIISALARLLIHPEFTEKLETVASYDELVAAIKDAQGSLE